MHLRLEETLPTSKRAIFSTHKLIIAFKRTVKTKMTMGYTMASGLIFGAFLGYLLSSQQIFVDMYKVGDLFPIYFGSLALVIGVVSFINSKLVEKLGMRILCFSALCLLFINSTIFVVLVFKFDGIIPLSIFMTLMLSTFSCVGILFGNFNSLAIEPLGDIAGMATAVISTLQNIVSISLATLIGASFNNTLYPMAFGFLFLSSASLICMIWTENFNIKFTRPS
jgi:DHA1 family bicyclomycin/chloramphenicol resistance-like MFS transporter